MMNKIALAESDEEILDCFSVMAELRPHVSKNEFLPTVKRLTENAGFQMAYLTDGEIKAVAGFRISEWLAGGKYMEIEDLAAKNGERSKGYGGELFDWLVEYAGRFGHRACARRFVLHTARTARQLGNRRRAVCLLAFSGNRQLRQMKISLRRTNESDLDFVLGAEQAAENRVFVSVWTREQHRAAFETEDLSHLVIENADGKRIGYIILTGLADANRSISLKRIVVTEKDQGYGKHALRETKKLAFKELKAHRLWLDVKEHNKRARHIYEAEGFIAEGILRECLKTENGYESLVVMSMLRGEYESKFQKVELRLQIAMPEDSEAIVAVLTEAFAEHKSSYTPQAYAATVPTVNDIKKRFSEGKIWIALNNKRIVGTVSVVPKKDSLYIRSMAILPEARGNRIGERLLEKIEDYAVAHDYRKLFLNTTPFLDRAIRLYKKFGFVRCGSDDLFGTQLLMMEKSLESESSTREVKD